GEQAAAASPLERDPRLEDLLTRYSRDPAGLRRDLLEYRERPPRRLTPRQLLCPPETFLLHLLSQLLRVGDFGQGPGNVVLVVGVDKPRRPSGDLWTGAGAWHDRGTRSSERLEDRDAEALAERRENEAFGRLIGEVNLVVRQEADERHIRE